MKRTLVFWDRFVPKRPLSGAPAARRVKTYAAQSGYSYEYWYEGHRPYRARGDEGTEFVFSVTVAGADPARLSVLVSAAAAHAWEQAHGRALAATELYAIAKMSLFQAFDERTRAALLQEPALVRAADIEAIAGTLDL
jgi:hypothetical protein